MLSKRMGRRALVCAFLTWAVGGGEWIFPRPGRFILMKKPSNYWLLGPRDGLDFVARRKTCPAGNRTLVVQPVA
jgi:hypothetical protein